jgi:hypothetical protein
MFFCTAFADPVYFKAVGNDGEVIFPGCSQLKLFDDRLIELDDLSALDADQMIVVARRFGFVSAELVVEPVFLHKTFFLQGVKRPVDGGQTDLRGLDPDETVDFLRAQMGMGFDQNLDDAQALLGWMDPVRPEMFREVDPV